VSTGTPDLIFLGAALLFMVGFFYFYVAGVHYRERALSRTAALAFLASGVMAVVFLLRILS
jgi:hypothetical protein